MKKIISLLFALASLLLPLNGLSEETAAPAAQGIRLDGSAFVDSLQYMLKGMVGIFLVTALIILAVVILEKATAKKSDQDE